MEREEVPGRMKWVWGQISKSIRYQIWRANYPVSHRKLVEGFTVGDRIDFVILEANVKCLFSHCTM